MTKFETGLQGNNKEQRLLEAKRKAQELWSSSLGRPSGMSMMAMSSAQRSEISDILDEATLLPATTTNTLPDNGDGQPNLLDRLQAAYGLTLQVELWADSEGDPGSFDRIEFIINGNVVETQDFLYPIVPATWDGTFFIAPNYLPAHGSSFIYYQVLNSSSGNNNSAVPTIFTVDSQDPHLRNQPLPAVLPDDLPNPGQITREYLDANANVIITVPEQADPKAGDTVSVYFGSSAVPLIKQRPIQLGGDFQVELPSGELAGLPSGTYQLEFLYTDRAGNESRRSLAVPVQLIQESAPVLRAPDVPVSPVNRLEAIAGVEVFADYSAPEGGDIIEFNWNGVVLGRVTAPVVNTVVNFDTINRFPSPYTANVTYTVNRRGLTSSPSPINPVPVDLEIVGPGPNPGPGPVNEDLDLLTVRAVGSTVDNQITPSDKGSNADISLPLYTGAQVGHHVRVYYGDTTTVVAEKTLDAADIAANTALGLVLLSARIDLIGNGTIDAFYRIFKDATAENYQESLPTPVVVTVNNLQSLPAPVFSGRNVSLNIINCAHRPWENGVALQILDPVNLTQGDVVYVDYAMHDRSGAISPTTPRTLRHQVTLNEAASGRITLRLPAEGGYWHIVTRGSLQAKWRLEKANGVSGTSLEASVNYNLVQPGSVICGL